MNIKTLFSLMKIRNIKAARLSCLLGLSRQSISAWKKKALKTANPNINIYSKTQDQLAALLGLKSEELNQSIEILEDPTLYKKLNTELLWDKIYPDLETFVAAIVKGHSSAFARLVHVYGLYQASKIAGKVIWQDFPKYKNKIPPTHKKDLEYIWKFEQDLT